MNDYLLSLILGIVEGITEFLPVSSTAHLRISQYLLNISLEDEYWKLYSIFIQLGAILAVAYLYRHRLAAFARDTLKAKFFEKGLSGMANHPTGLLAIGFVATAGPAFLLKKMIGNNLESLTVMYAAMFIGGVVMLVVDKAFAHGKIQAVEAMGPWRALFIGLVEVLSAVFPGTSRSMSTIAGGQIVGLSRTAALEYSFLLSIPVMTVATIYDLYKYVKEGGHEAMTSHQMLVLAEGFLISYIVAYFVVAWFLGYVRKHGFLIFGIYRVLLAPILWFTLGR